MSYDFTSYTNRFGKDAYAVDAVLGRSSGWGFEPRRPKEGFDFIPMWVADMNFATAPAVTDAIISRVQHPLFGYYSASDAYYNSILSWHERRHHFSGLKREDIGYENGVHGMVTSAIQILSSPGDKILLHSPVYVGYASDIEGTGRKSVYSPLLPDENGVWRMDFEDMERKIKENRIHLVVFCSPHNPTGRVWERWELEKAFEIFERYECYVISDEIWCDIILGQKEHIPLLLVNEWAKSHVLAAYAPSKTFNLAGLIGSYHIIPDPFLRDRLRRYEDNIHYNEMNVLSMHALMGAYSASGEDWVGALTAVLRGNAEYAVSYINGHFPGVWTAMPEATYMLFLDCTRNLEQTGRSMDQLLEAGWEVGVGWQDGRDFEGPCHIRLNLALPRTKLEEAMERLSKYVF